MNKSDFLENRIIDSVFRGGALTNGGLINSTAVAASVWAPTTAYTLGQVVVPASTMTAGGGKFLLCTTAGTSGSTTTLAVPNPGNTLSDGSVTWTAVSGMPSPLTLYMALFVINRGLRLNSTAYSVGDVVSLTANGGAGGDTRQHLYRCSVAGTSAGSQSGFLGVPGESISDNSVTWVEIGPVFDSNTGFPAGLVEVSGGSYARVRVSAAAYLALGDWAGTQSAGSTTSSTGAGGTTSNNGVITFAAPTANWASGSAQLGAACLYDQPSGAANLYYWGVLSAPKTVNSGDAAPSFAAASFSVQDDN